MNVNAARYAGDQTARSHRCGTHFGSYLRDNPDARTALKERIKAYPEYEQWLRQIGGDVLPALDEN